MYFFSFLHTGETMVPSKSEYDENTAQLTTSWWTRLHVLPSWLEIRIKASKADPFSKGVSINIGISGNGIWPVAPILSYRVQHGLSNGLIFVFSDGLKVLTRTRSVTHLKEALATAGIDQTKYSGHSFRIGAATKALACGVQDSLIKTLPIEISVMHHYTDSEHEVYISLLNINNTTIILTIMLYGTCIPFPLLDPGDEDVASPDCCASKSEGFG